MADTTFTAQVTTILAAWLNVINNAIYRGKRPTYGTTTGAANVFSLALDSSSLVTAAGLADGDSFLFRAHQANSGAATFALTVGATTIGSAAIQVAGAALAGGEILSGGIYQVTRVSSVWQLNGQALAITLPLPIASGGTGQVTAGAALAALGGAASGANTDITSVYLNNTGLKVKDTDASHGLTFIPGSNLSADRTLTFLTGDANRSITLGGDFSASAAVSITGALTLAAAFTTAGANALTLTTTGTTNVTLPTTGTLAATEATSYTATLTGCSTAPTYTVKYTKTGNQVTLQIPATTATSNATTKSLTGAPAAIQPATQQRFYFLWAQDNGGAFVLCSLVIETTGVMNMYYNTENAWTNSGTFATRTITVSYTLA